MQPLPPTQHQPQTQHKPPWGGTFAGRGVGFARHFVGTEDLPSAPPLYPDPRPATNPLVDPATPSADAPDIPPADPSPSDTVPLPEPSAPPAGDAGQARSQDSLNSLRYAVELLLFAVVGWGWLSVREYISATPVLDVAVLLSVLVTSCLNMAFVLFCKEAVEFAPYAQAYLSHALALTTLYAYGLAESVASRSPTLACDGGAGFSLSLTYREAFFGGMPLHQAAGGVTLAYLAVLLLLAAAQARACSPAPGSWLLRGTAQSAVAFVTLHLALFLAMVPMTDKDRDRGGPPGLHAGASAVLSPLLLGLTLLVMADFAWVRLALRRDPLAELDPGDVLVQKGIELAAAGGVGLYANLLYSSMFGAASPPLLVVTLFVVFLCCLSLLFDLLAPHGRGPAGKLAAAPGPARRPPAVQLAHAAGLHGRLNCDGIFARRAPAPCNKSKPW